jgi:hypothetical protein
MSRQNTDQLYIEIGYFEPEEYYVYVAEATAAPSDTFTVTASIGVIKAAAAELTAEFSQQGTISHIQGADLFAFSEAQLQLAVDRIRDNNVDATAVFDTAVDYIRIVQSDSIAEAVFALDSDAERSRDYALDATAAFSFDIVADRFAEHDADLTSDSTLVILEQRIRDSDVDLESNIVLTAEVGVIKQAESQASSDFDLTATISHIHGADIVANGFAELQVDAEVFKDFGANLFAESSLTADYNVISEDVIVVLQVFAELDVNAIATLVIEAQLDSKFEISVLNDRIIDVDSTQTSEASVFAEIEITRGFSSDLTAVAEQTADVNATLSADIAAEVNTALFCIISHIQGADLVAFSDATVVVDADVTRGFDADLVSETEQIVDATILIQTSSVQSAVFDLNADPNSIFVAQSSVDAEFNLSALGGLTVSANAALVANGGLLTLGRLVNLDMKVYVIPAETRQYIIAAETRNHRIGEETRIHSIRSTK